MPQRPHPRLRVVQLAHFIKWRHGCLLLGFAHGTALEVLELQMEGKKRMSAARFHQRLSSAQRRNAGRDGVSPMPVSPARAAAFDILLRVEQQDAYASELLHSDRLDQLSSPIVRLTTEIVMGVLRWRSRLDDAIAAAVLSTPCKA